jgi:hypothetical protein
MHLLVMRCPSIFIINHTYHNPSLPSMRCQEYGEIGVKKNLFDRIRRMLNCDLVNVLRSTIEQIVELGRMVNNGGQVLLCITRLLCGQA